MIRLQCWAYIPAVPCNRSFTPVKSGFTSANFEGAAAGAKPSHDKITEEVKRIVRPCNALRRCWIVSALLLVVFANRITWGAPGSIFSIIPSPSPNVRGNTLNAVAAISATDAWAVGFQNDNQLNGSRTLTEHWDGTQWSVVPSPNPGSTPSCIGQNTGNVLNAVAAISPNNVWGVGFSFGCSSLLKPMILHWNGSKWRTVSSPPLLTNDNSALNDILAFSASNIYAVGYQPAANGAVQTLVEHWDGTAWSVVPTPNGNNTGSPLNAISGTSPSDIWVVGDLAAPNTPVLTLTEHFDGVSWTVIPSPSPITGSDLDQNVLTGVKAFAPNNVTAVGFTLDFANQRELTLVEHWDGTSWKVVPSPNQSEDVGSLNTLTRISGFGPHDLYAVGFYADAQTGGQPTALVEHFDGSGWSIIPSPSDGLAQQLNGVFALPRSRNIWTVGAFSTNGADPETGLLQVPQTLVLFSPGG